MMDDSEITPEMIEAGVTVFYENIDSRWELPVSSAVSQTLMAVYTAMAKCKSIHRHRA